MTDTSEPRQERSTFVTTVAWIFIVLAGFSTVISGIQNVMFQLVFSSEAMHGRMTAEQLESVPAVARFMFEHMGLLFLGFFILSAVTFVSSIGLLKRKNWARMTFIVLMALAIAWNISGLFVQHSMMPGPTPFPHDAPSDVRAHFDTMKSLMIIVSYVFALGFSVLFGWILWKLTRPKIVGEFVQRE